jgi:hypothetical protein
LSESVRISDKFIIFTHGGHCKEPPNEESPRNERMRRRMPQHIFQKETVQFNNVYLFNIFGSENQKMIKVSKSDLFDSL